MSAGDERPTQHHKDQCTDERVLARLLQSAAVLFAKKQYDRSQTLEAAEKARAKGKKSKAISEYRKILAHEPNDAAIHGKLAPLLADTSQLDDAWKSFGVAAKAQVDKGFVDRGIAIYHQAAMYFPRRVDLWGTMAKLHADRGRKADAIKVLLEGQSHFHRKKDEWPNAIKLLRQALKIDEHNVAGTIALASLLKRSGQSAEAVMLIDTLLPKIGGKGKKLLLGARFKVKPGFSSFWRWFRA